MMWQAGAACADHPNPELWFPETGGTDVTEAVLVCSSCPVRVECGLFAEEHRTLGVWGGVRRTAKKAYSRYVSPMSYNDATLTPHGTPAAIRRHHRKHEPLCTACALERSAIEAKQRAAGRVAS